MENNPKKDQTTKAKNGISLSISANVLVLFGTRPEAIKLAPIISELKKVPHFHTIVVSSSQHTDLLAPFLETFSIKTDYDLKVMSANQSLNQVLAKTIAALDEILEKENPDLIIVQGDTTTTLAGALAGFNRDIAIGHVEAGLRTGNIRSPFPEEMNRKLTSQLATFHFAATGENRQNLLRENVPESQIYVTGNTIVDALHLVRANFTPSKEVKSLVSNADGNKIIMLTTHRRESFREFMGKNLIVLRDFVKKHKNVSLIFPVHPNPNVRRIAEEILSDCERVILTDPLDYRDFVYLMEHSWLIVSDSGGVQEEAPSLGKPVFILRDTTERPEAVQCGVAKLVGGNPRRLATMLEDNYLAETWINSVKQVQNPFGDGKSAERITKILSNISKPLSTGN
ncbi:MAG: UDP-N-acetylglucosamine 2-epimerase (non-hydrolyzing) [Acidobacteria bacterium]|nr:UDP-N-acetylglucosamine 2-epimerase (non-hydrolyzing) [Acidobacteriota bacterium]